MTVGVAVPDEGSIAASSSIVPTATIGQYDFRCSGYQIDSQGGIHCAGHLANMLRIDAVTIDIEAGESQILSRRRVMVAVRTITGKRGDRDIVGLARIHRYPVAGGKIGSGIDRD